MLIYRTRSAAISTGSWKCCSPSSSRRRRCRRRNGAGRGRILKVILYGSYARGDWVDDPIGGYQSDYDILVVVSDERLTEPGEFWAKADDQFVREVMISKRISAPVSFIVHSLADVNNQLTQGRPFFIDVIEQGIALYEVEDFPFVTPRPLEPKAARAEAQKHFDKWFPGALRRFDMARGAIEKGYTNEAAFDLHQTTEQLYHCLLLTLTLYSPKSHKLNFLRSQAEPLVHELIAVWPRDTKFAQRCFELLRQAYVNARYSPALQSDARRTRMAGRTRRAAPADRQRDLRKAARASLTSVSLRSHHRQRRAVRAASK